MLFVEDRDEQREVELLAPTNASKWTWTGCSSSDPPSSEWETYESGRAHKSLKNSPNTKASAYYPVKVQFKPNWWSNKWEAAPPPPIRTKLNVLTTRTLYISHLGRLGCWSLQICWEKVEFGTTLAFEQELVVLVSDEQTTASETITQCKKWLQKTTSCANIPHQV